MKKSKKRPVDFAERRRVRRRRSLQIILEVVAEGVREFYMRERRLREEVDTGTPSAYEPGVRWDGGVDRHGKEHPAIWPRIAKVIVLHGLSPDPYVRAVFEMQLGAAIPTPKMLLNPVVLAQCEYAASVGGCQLDVALTSQQNALESQMEMGMTIGGDNRREIAMFDALLDENMSASALFRYCVGHREGFAEVCRTFRLAAVAQYMRRPAEYDRAWGKLIPVSVKKEAKALRRMLVEQA